MTTKYIIYFFFWIHIKISHVYFIPKLNFLASSLIYSCCTSLLQKLLASRKCASVSGVFDISLMKHPLKLQTFHVLYILFLCSATEVARVFETIKLLYRRRWKVNPFFPADVIFTRYYNNNYHWYKRVSVNLLTFILQFIWWKTCFIKII